MFEQQITISEKINGVLTYPAQYGYSNESQIPAVLMLHGFGSDGNEVNNFYRNIATQLAEKNIISLRIDFRGYGSSASKPENISINDMINDSVEAFNHLMTLQNNPKKLGVVGFSLGAAIAIMLSKQKIFNSLVLISPVLNLLDDFTVFFGNETMKKLSECRSFIEVDLTWRKINIGKSFFESLGKTDVVSGVVQFNGNLLCVAGENDFSAKNAVTIYDTSPSIHKKLEVILGADHIFNMTRLPSIEKIVSERLSFSLMGKPFTSCVP